MPYVRKDDYFEFEITVPVPMDTVVIQGELVGVTKFPYDPAIPESSGPGLAYIEGEYRLKKAAEAITQGTAVYYDATNKVVTATASGNAALGICSRDAASDDSSVFVFLNR